MYENLKVYRGTTFDCSISLVDRKRNTYLLSEGDKLIFGVKPTLKVDTETNKEPEDIIRKELTIDDEIARKYHFKLSPTETSLPNKHYYYYVAIEMADGDYYQIAPYSCFDVSLTIALSYDKGQEICCQVPKIMKRKSCKSTHEQILEFIRYAYDKGNTVPVRIRNFGNVDIVIVNNHLDHHKISCEQLLNIIEKKLDCFDSENYIIIGFNHTTGSLQNTWQSDYNAAIRQVFETHFFDLENCMKELVYSENQELISSKALQTINMKPSENDLHRIAFSQYPICILNDDMHFNDTGYRIITEIITKEIEKYAI